MQKNLRPWSRLAIALGLCSGACAAQATLITFDDLPWQPPAVDPEVWYAQPVTDQYASLGVQVAAGYLAQGNGTISPPQYLLGGPSFTVTFTGTLPHYVSLYLSSPNFNLQSYVNAYGPDGLLGSGNTGGESPGLPEGSVPYVPNTYVSFASQAGISFLSFGNPYDLRTSAILDNLYFGAVPAVPEPSPLALAGAGLACLAGLSWWQRRRGAGRVRINLGR